MYKRDILKLQSYTLHNMINLKSIKTKDPEILELISSLEKNKNFHNSFLRNGKIYSYPLLFSHLSKKQREVLNITKKCKLYCIIKEVEETKDEYILTGFTFMDQISFYDFEAINYTLSDGRVEKFQTKEFAYDTDGITTMVNNGVSLIVPKSYKGRLGLYINYKGLKKSAYVCDINDGIEFNYQNTKLNFRKHFYRLIKFTVIDDSTFSVDNYLSNYVGIEEIKFIISKSFLVFNINKKMKITNGKPIKLMNDMKLANFLPSTTFSVSSGSRKYRINYRATIGNVYKKSGFKINGKNLVYDIRTVKLYDKMKKLYIRMKNLVRQKSVVEKNPDINIIDKCIEFEKRNNMIEKSWLKINPWQVGRFIIITGIDAFHNSKSEMFSGKRKQKDDHEYTEIGALLCNLSEAGRNPFTDSSKNSSFVIDNLRKVKFEDEYIDPASYYYIRDVLSANEDEINVCDNEYIFKHLSDEKYRRYLDGSRIFQIYYDINKFAVPAFIRKVGGKKITEVLDDFDETVSATFNLRKSLLNWTRRYIYEYTYTFLLFNEIRPKDAYVVGPYRQWVYHVAKHYNIPSYEFQYAAIEYNHLAYGYKKSEHLKPDTMIVWSDFWRKELSRNNKFKYINFSNYYYYEHNEHNAQSVPTYDVLFLSQNAIGNEILEFAYKFAKENSDLSILYRLHPHEELSLYELAKHCQDLDNFEFTTFNQESTYESTAKSKFIVGVYSTTVIESLANYKPVALLNIRGIEYMKNFVDEFSELNVYDNTKKLRRVYNKSKDYHSYTKFSKILFGDEKAVVNVNI